MSLAADVAAALRAVIDRTIAIRAGISTAQDRGAEATQILQAATRDTSDHRPGEAIARLAHAHVALDEAAALVAAAGEDLGVYVTDALGMTGGSGQPPAPGPPRPPRRDTRPGPHPGWRPDRPSPPHVDAIKAIGWPKKSGTTDDVRARGQVYHRDGTPWDAGVLIASRRGPARDRTDLREPWASDPDYSTTWHIEGNIAALMVRHGQREAVLYINQAVCGSEDPRDPRRCDVNLPKVLPVGYTLYVHSVQENGWTRRRIYKGTGEAIR